MWLFGLVGEALVAGPGAAHDAGRVWATGWGVGSEGQGRGLRWGGLELWSRVLCRCMCPLAAACCVVTCRPGVTGYALQGAARSQIAIL